MDKVYRLLNGIRALLLRGVKERELDSELRHHIELETEKNIREGMGPAEARRKALVDFGGVERFKEKTRAVHGLYPLEGFLKDLRFAARRIIRQPGSSLAIVLCLGLGLGATAGVFSFFFGIVLRPLPFADADRLAILFETAPGFTRASPTFTDFEGWRENASAFSGLGAYSRINRTVTGAEGPEILEGTKVSHDLLGILRVQPALGRGFTPEDDGPGAPPTVILSDRLWEERYGGAREILGSAITLDGTPHTVVGVMPPGFAFPEEARFWIPLRTNASPDGGSLTAVLGRFAPGVTLEAARADMARVAAIMRGAYPEANAQREITVRPLEEDFLWGLKRPVTLFLVVAGFVLLLSTANVANLLLAQGTTRGREMMVRMAMGAGRPRILRQLLTESLLLAGAGGVLGVLLGLAGRNLFLSFLPEAFPYFLDFAMDGHVVGILALLTMGVAFLFGLFPAVETTRVDLFSGLRGGGEGEGPTLSGFPEGAGWLMGSIVSGRGARSGLLVLQTALAVVVLMGAGMVARSLADLRRVPTGLDPENLLTLQVAFSPEFRGDAVRLRLAYTEIRDRVAGLPGVESAALISHLPIVGAANGTSLTAEGVPAPPPGEEPWVIAKQSQPGYFHTMGISLLAGRDFRPEDGALGSVPVVIVNESFARRHWPGQEAVGRRVKYGRPEDDYPWMEVVGVAADVRHFGQDRPVELGLYEPMRQMPYWRENLVVRTAGEARGLVPAILDAIRRVDPNAPVSNVFTMEVLLFRSHWQPVVLARLLWIFSGMAVLLAGLGVYGVVAFSTAQRRREFGIRVALGAEGGVVITQAIRGIAAPALWGLAAGLAVAAVGMRFVSGLLFGVEGLNPMVALSGALGMGLFVLAAAVVPARKAACLVPAEVLRGE